MNKFIFITFLSFFIISMNSYAEGILVCGEDGYCYYEDEDTVAENPDDDIVAEDSTDNNLPSQIADSSVPDDSANEIQIAKVRTLSLNIAPKNGTVTLINGELVYTPNPGFYGEDYFTYIDDEGNLRTVRLFIKAPGTGETSVSVSDIVTEPEPKPESKPEPNPEPITYATTAKPGEPLVVTISGDYKLGEQDLTINNPNHGVVANNNNGTLTYTSEQNYSGKDSFSYKVDNKYTFIIEIEIASQTSVMEALSLVYADHIEVVRTGMLLTIDISANYNWHTQMLVINRSSNSTIKYGKNILFYFSKPNFRGYDNFSYTVTDKKNAANSNTYTARVEVQEENPFKQMSMNSCQVYAVDDIDFADSQLISIDPAGYASVEIGPLYKGLDIEGLAIDPTTNILYGVSGSDYSPVFDGRLYEINPNNGDIKIIGDTGFSELASLAFHSDGTLWAWSNKGSKDGTQEPGLVLIDPETANSQLVYPMPEGLFSQKNEGGIEGLAWSSNGSTLYASEGRKLWQWNCETGFEMKCNNFPGKQVEALETLADGMLLFSINNNKVGNTAYVYNPETCDVVYERSFNTSVSYTDIESLVWPLNCQLAAPISDEKVTFDGFEDSQKEVCLTEPQWIEVTGNVTIPNGSLAYLKTSWTSSEDVTDQCTTCGNCSQKWQTITSVTNQFKIKAWWPGLSNRSVATSYIVELHDRERNLISTNEVTLVGSPEACGITTNKISTTSAVKPITAPLSPNVANMVDYLGSGMLQINNDGSFSIQLEAKIYSYKFKGSSPALPNKALSINTIGDVNNDGYIDYLVTEPLANGNVKKFQLLYAGTTDAQSTTDAIIPSGSTIEQELKSSSPNISNDGIITIEARGQKHSYSFKGSTPLLPLSGKVTVQLQNDINGDTYVDYQVTDGSGNKYSLLYLGMD